MKKYLLCMLSTFCYLWANGQCPAGQVEVNISIQTDNWGNEGYFQLLPAGNACGTGTIFAGGNPNVGCLGAGNQSSPPGGYPNNTTVNEGPWCLDTGSTYDIFYTDDYLDGGFTFTIIIGGYPVYSGLTASGNNSRLSFIANPPPALDLSVRSIKMNSYVNFGSVYPQAWVTNLGTDTIQSFDLYFEIDNGTPQVSNITGVNIAPFDSILVTSTTAWTVGTISNFSVEMYASNPNGSTDMNPANDATQRTVAGGPPTPNIINDYLTSTPVYTVVANSTNQVNKPSDLDFHPVLTRYECWVVLRGTEASGGSTVKISNAGQPSQTVLKQTDGNAWHFMSLPSGIAFSENENFGTSPSVYDANHDGGNPFTGPALWSSDPAVYAITPPGGNGSHLDMLHESPYSMGICAEIENKFWVYDNNDNEIVSYDFRSDHGPGASDHSDGVIHRYTGLGLAGDPNNIIGSHLILDKDEGFLYIADTYNDRILKMDINSGTFMQNLNPSEPVEEYSEWGNVSYSEIVATGITKPSGIDMIDDRLVVSEYNSGDIVIYDISGSTGVEIARLQTGSPGVMGVKIGPDGKIWYVNYQTNEVVRIDQLNVGIDKNEAASFSMYPNPASDKLNFLFEENHADIIITINDAKGATVLHQEIATGTRSASTDVSSLASGVYSISLKSNDGVSVRKFVKE